MNTRGPRLSLVAGALLALVMPLRAQVRPVLMSALSVMPSAAAVSAVQSVGASAMAPLLAAPSLAIAVLPVDASPIPVAAVSLSVLTARSPDGAPLSGPELAFPSTPLPAPRGDALAFNGQSLPTRMDSDKTQISQHLVRAIDATQKTLDVAIYELAIREIHAALQRAKARGVRVRIVMDQSHVFPEKQGQSRTAEVQALIDEGFDMKMLRGGDLHGIMHNKFAVFDGELLETGSYNWARAADVQHYENALFLSETARVASYQNYWEWMWSQARPIDLSRPPVAVVIGEDGHGPDLPPAPQDGEKPVEFNGVGLPAESFTPQGTAVIIASAIDAARLEVLVANFSFTNATLIEALKRAKDRGLEVRIVFDRYQYKFLKEMADMRDLGFDVRLSDGKGPGRGVMHNKFVVLDSKLVETGSFNWTTNGERNNYENAVFLDAPDDAASYRSYFERIWARARPATDADHTVPAGQIE
ncbi:MAG: hypothetical protein A2V88_11645 [Elusimicrobia bacterium RBG_16_66_12]|nr:MAG: hypothetical protein A2V88_11645 [Elusimicrobia bacterium RBG_16_66_12]